MDKKLGRFLFLVWLIGLLPNSQVNAQPTNTPVSITVGIDNIPSFTFNALTSSFPVTDLLNQGATPIFPDTDTLVTELKTLDVNGGTVNTKNVSSPITTIMTLPFETYIQGVVFGEVAIIHQTSGLANLQELDKAEAVAARSFVAGLVIPYKYHNNPLSLVSDGNTYTYDTIGDPTDQVYAAYVTAISGWDDGGAMGQTVESTANQALYCFDRNNGGFTANGAVTGIDQIMFGMFGSSFGGGSNDEMFLPPVTNFWHFPPYLKSRQSYDVGFHPVVAIKLGLSQWGSGVMADSGWNYQAILNYFYAVNPPIVRAIDIYQDSETDNNLMVSGQWDDVASSGPSTTIDDMNICPQPDYRQATTFTNNSLTAGTTAIIDITTNESIDPRVGLTVVLGSGENSVTAIGKWGPVSIGHFPVERLFFPQ